MKHKKHFLFFILCIPVFLFGGEELGYIDKTHRLLSDFIYNTSNKIDTFFARKDLKYHIQNRSYINLSFNSYMEEHANMAYKFNIRARIRLPKTQKRFNLIFEDFKNSVSTDQQTSSRLNDTLQDNSYLVGIGLDKIDTKYMKLKYSLGIHFSGISPDGYISLYLSRMFYYKDNWEMELNNNVKYFAKKHLDNTAQLLFLKIITENYKFTFLNSYRYNEENNHANEVLNALILDRYISAKKGISGSFSIFSSSDDESSFKLHYYLVQASYKRFFYHNFAYYKFSPGVIFRDTDGFKSRARVVFQIGLYFSKFALGGYNKFK